MSVELDYIVTFNETMASIYNYYKIMPSFLIGYSALCTNYGSSKLYKETNNAFKIIADAKWKNNEGKYYNYNNEDYKKYDSLIESIVDFCEIFKSKLSYLKLDEIYIVLNSQIKNDILSSEIQKVIEKYDLTRYDTLITKTSEDFIIHQLDAGTTLKEVSEVYGVTVAEIVRTNNITSLSELYAGKTIKIPVPNNTVVY